MEVRLYKRLIGIGPNGNQIYAVSSMNPHILITGCSGSGKTYLTYNIMIQDILRNIPVIIIDVADSFKLSELPDEFKAELFNRIKIYDIAKEGIPIDIFSPKKYMNSNEIIKTETFNDVADRIASILKKSFRLGKVQYATLRKAVFSIIQEDGVTFKMLIEKLFNGNNDSKHLAEKLSPVLENINISTPQGDMWEGILNSDKAELTIFQLSSLADMPLRIVSDIIMEDMFRYVKFNHKSSVTLVLDELHNMTIKTDSIIAKLLAESRKFGMSLICSTQFMKFTNDKTIVGKLEQAGTKIYLAPNEQDRKSLIALLSDGTRANKNKWQSIIKDMSRGKCLVINDSNNRDESGVMAYIYPIGELIKEVKTQFKK